MFLFGRKKMKELVSESERLHKESEKLIKQAEEDFADTDRLLSLTEDEKRESFFKLIETFEKSFEED